MKAFTRLAIITTLATYLLIFTGGLVRVSGAGLGCPDWPKCFGRWVPPLSVSQLPVDIDPAQFNFALAWIEYVNRLIGVAVGLLIAAVAVMAIISYRRHPKILIASILAAVLVAFQGWQGGQVVASELAPLLVSVHLVIALVIGGLMIYVSQRAWYLERPDTEKESAYPAGLRMWVGLLWVLALVQVILGTQVREAIETAMHDFPLLPDSELIGAVGVMKYVHPLLGAVIAVAAWIIVFRLVKAKNRPSPIVWQSGWSVAGLVLVQLLVGAVLTFVGIPAVMQVLHMWVAALLTGAILVSYVALGQAQEG
ncbi:MAG: COX15/CtaA family protein [candidate division Zixibacteria bacterium]|nr:COX15/CtaA family protein [candidate division Zixibacteria bacterium]